MRDEALISYFRSNLQKFGTDHPMILAASVVLPLVSMRTACRYSRMKSSFASLSGFIVPLHSPH